MTPIIDETLPLVGGGSTQGLRAHCVAFCSSGGFDKWSSVFGGPHSHNKDKYAHIYIYISMYIVPPPPTA